MSDAAGSSTWRSIGASILMSIANGEKSIGKKGTRSGETIDADEVRMTSRGVYRALRPALRSNPG